MASCFFGGGGWGIDFLMSVWFSWSKVEQRLKYSEAKTSSSSPIILKNGQLLNFKDVFRFFVDVYGLNQLFCAKRRNPQVLLLHLLQVSTSVLVLKLPATDWRRGAEGVLCNSLVVSNILYVHPENQGWFPIWRAYFSNGLKPPTR